jgi:hypothetical protein
LAAWLRQEGRRVSIAHRDLDPAAMSEPESTSSLGRDAVVKDVA